MEKKKVIKDSLIVGFAVFAVFFGAGNLVFPPQIGLVSGAKIAPALIGMALSGVLFPMMGFYAVCNMGNNIEDVMKRGHKNLYVLFTIMTLPTGICGSLPRCGSVAYEVGLLGMLPDLPGITKYVFLALFFGLAFWVASSRSSLADLIGKFITPILLICLLIIVALAIVDPIGISEGGTVENAFGNAFVTSINTGDIMTGVMCAGIFVIALKEKGYSTRKERKRMMINVIAVAFIILFTVYGGLAYLGSTGTRFFSADTDNTVLLVGLVTKLAGYGGIVVLSIAVIFACFSTEAGLIAMEADLLQLVAKGRGDYKKIALAVTLITMLIATTGVSSIINISGPFFMMVFPFCIVVTILGCFHRFIPNDGAWKGAILMSLIVGLHDGWLAAYANGLISFKIEAIDNLFAAVPLAGYGFTWLIPSSIGGIIGAIVFKALGKESLPEVED